MQKVDKATMTVIEMAEVLGVSKVTAYDITERADFTALLRVGRKKLILTDKFYEWLDQCAGKNIL